MHISTRCSDIDKLKACVAQQREDLINVVIGLHDVVVEGDESNASIIFVLGEREDDRGHLPVWRGEKLLEAALTNDGGFEKIPPILTREEKG